MIYFAFIILIFVLIYGPQFWIGQVLDRYNQNQPHILGTGAELAKHLIERFELVGVKVEETGPRQDHYDPKDKVVRLSPDHYHGNSLTAVAVAAHEVGHAIQFYREEPISKLRNQFLPLAFFIKRAAAAILAFAPILTLFFPSPKTFFLIVLIALGAQLISALVYLIILPEEWDASFCKALPILTKGDYISEQEVPHVRRILKAAALTYFASALADVLHIWRWIAVLKGIR